MKFRSDISFLRALSVIAVLLYHFKFSFFKGGFVGVDVFFVISGYLMTRIILSGFDKNNFIFWEYLQKRVTRIIPALLVMITFFAFVIYFLLPTLFLPYLDSYFSSILFFSNIYYYLNSNYFDNGSQFNFLLHTWSLSVEWQFYMIYPFILILFKKLYINNLSRFKLVFLVLVTLSFAAMLIHSEYDSSFSFYNFYTRAWEMMFGGIAFLFADNSKDISTKIKNCLLSFFLLLICGSIYFINSHSYIWPSAFTLIPVIATTGILFLNVDWAIFRNKGITYIGNISYSLYLWHWPLYVLSLYFGLNMRLRYKVFFIALSVIFAVLSYHFIEKRAFKNKSVHIVLTCVILFLASFSLKEVNIKKIFSPEVSNLSFANSKYKYSDEAVEQYSLYDRYLLHTRKFSEYDLNYLNVESGKKYIVLLGDSHAGMFSKTVEEIAKGINCEIIQVTADATYPMINSEGPFQSSKELFNYFFQQQFPKIKDQISLIVICSKYNGYDKAQLEKRISFTENFFNKTKTKTIYLGQTPSFPIDFPTYYYMKERYGITSDNDPDVKKKDMSTNEFLKKKLDDKYLDLMSINIKTVDQGKPFIYDTNHLTYFGAEQYKAVIKDAIVKVMKTSQF
jgi:peptidoglycan/LPS O-acetylase OafA/YrhL